MRTAFRDILSDHLSLACHHLKIERPPLNELADFQKLAFRIGQVYGMPDAQKETSGQG